MEATCGVDAAPAPPAPGDEPPQAVVVQQLDELKREAQEIQPLLEALYPELFPPKFVYEELSACGGVAAGLFGMYKLLRIVPFSEAVFAHLRNGMLAAATLFISWRLATRCAARLVDAIRGHRRKRRVLLRRWQGLTERVERLHKLAGALSGAPALAPGLAAAAAAAPAPRMQGARPGAPAAAAAPSAAASAALAVFAAVAGGAGDVGLAPEASVGFGAYLDAPVESADSSLELESAQSLQAASPAAATPAATLSRPPAEAAAAAAVAAEAAQQQQQEQQQQQQQRAVWGAGMAGWSQLYTRPPAARSPLHAAAEPGPAWPGGSPVMLPKPWDNGGDDSDEEWEAPQFAHGSGASGGGGGAR